MFLLAKTLVKEGTGPSLNTPRPGWRATDTRRAGCMARPKKAPEERRDDQINPRLTTAERAEIERNAHLLGITPTEFVRRRALGYRLPASAAAQHHTASLGSAFNRLGVNMNQIAHRLNAGADPSEVEASLRALIARVNAELDGIYGPGDNRGGPEL